MKGEIDKLRRFDFRTAAENTLDPDGKLRATAKDVNDGVAAPTPYKPPVPVEEPPPDAPAVIRLTPRAKRRFLPLFRLAPGAGVFKA